MLREVHLVCKVLRLQRVPPLRRADAAVDFEAYDVVEKLAILLFADKLFTSLSSILGFPLSSSIPKHGFLQTSASP